jgi:hypothetical protein
MPSSSLRTRSAASQTENLRPHQAAKHISFTDNGDLMHNSTRRPRSIRGLLVAAMASSLVTLLTGPAVAAPTPSPSPSPSVSAAPGSPAEAPRQAAPAASSPAATAAPAARAAANDPGDPGEDDGLPTTVPQKLAAAREIGPEPPPEWLNQTDRNFVFKIWQATAAQPLIRNAAELALSADDDTIEAVCKTFILQGIYDAKKADDAKRISDETAARQARELKRTAYAAAKIPVDADGHMLVLSERDVVFEIWDKATGARIKAAAEAALKATADDRHTFLLTGVQAAADQDVKDAIAAAEAQGKAEQERIARRGAMIAAAAVLGILADEGKLAMTNDNFVFWMWDLADGDPRRIEIAAAARAALRSSDDADWRAFINTGIYTANRADRARLEQEAEAADRRNAESIKAQAATDGFDNLVTAATQALATKGPAEIDNFVRIGRNQVAPDSANRPGGMSWQWRNVNSEKCLAVAGDNLTNGTQVVQANCADNDKQQWIAMRVYNTPDRYRIINAADRTKCIGLAEKAAANNIGFVINGCNGDPDQYFKHLKVGDHYIWTNDVAGRAITVQNASRDHGAAISTFDVDNGNDQQWQPANTRLLAGQELGEAKFLLSHIGHAVRLQGDGNVVITKGGRPIWDTKTTTGVRLINQSDGNLVVRKSDGYAIWASGTHGNGPSTLKMQPDGNLVLYRNDNNKAIWSSGVFDFSFVSRLNKKCINVPGTSFENSVQLEMRTCNNSSFQKWTHDATKSHVSFNGKCMDVKGSGRTNGTILQLYTCNNSVAQKFEYYSDGSWRNPNSGLCIDIPNSRPDDGVKLHLWTCNNTPAQKW